MNDVAHAVAKPARSLVRTLGVAGLVALCAVASPGVAGADVGAVAGMAGAGAAPAPGAAPATPPADTARPVVGTTGIVYSHAFAHLTTARYGPDFTHYDYVRPDAPRGGTIRVPVMGTWDSFNFFIDRGRAAEGMGFLSGTNLMYDRLLDGASDESGVAYGRLADGIAVAPDFSWVAFRLREGAYWHDGRPITIDDFIFTFETYKQHASAWVQTMIADIDRVERIGPREIRYVMKEGVVPNPSITGPIGVMPVLPKHYWEGRDPAATTIEPPLGSGPYRIASFEVGRNVVFERVDDYWGNDVPSLKGRFNFGTVKFDYFRDEQVMLEAMRGHVVDVLTAIAPRAWVTEFDFPAAREGLFHKRMFEVDRAVGLNAPLFWNMRRERFRDARVREALWLLYDFGWANSVLHQGYYEQGMSLFHGSPDMAQSGVPEGRERALLEPWRAQLPARLFDEPYRVPPGSGPFLDRRRIDRAVALFREAGWEVREGRLTHVASGEVFRIDFVLVSHAQARELMPYVDALTRFGIEVSVRVPEASNWRYRMQTGQFDAGRGTMPPYTSPGIAVRNHFGTASADTGFGVNWGYVKDPVVDFLADRIVGASTREDFLAAVHAVDRVLLWNFYLMPGSALPGDRIAWWDKFGRVEQKPEIGRVPWLDAWWWDAEKAARVERALGNTRQEAD
jgi:microcin C transport system substrate-binding protein